MKRVSRVSLVASATRHHSFLRYLNFVFDFLGGGGCERPEKRGKRTKRRKDWAVSELMIR